MSDHRRGEFYLPLLSVLMDAAAIEAAFLFAYWLRFETVFFADFGFVDATKPAFVSYQQGSVVVVFVWLLLFQARGMYAVRRNVSLADELFGGSEKTGLGEGIEEDIDRDGVTDDLADAPFEPLHAVAQGCSKRVFRCCRFWWRLENFAVAGGQHHSAQQGDQQGA